MASKTGEGRVPAGWPAVTQSVCQWVQGIACIPAGWALPAPPSSRGSKKSQPAEESKKNTAPGLQRDHQLFPRAVWRELDVNEAEAWGCNLAATAQPSALAGYLFIDTLLLVRSSSWGSPGMSTAPVCAVLGRQQATRSHSPADAARL